VGHHVQTLLGIAGKVHAARQQAGEVEANRMQVRMELQADCFAGIWAHHADKARGILERGDVEEALAAASGVGDDRLQQQSRGHVVPDSFTHGSSEQRMRWFGIGAKTGDPKRCDTFKTARL
jgi:predicted metalloprotease